MSETVQATETRVCFFCRDTEPNHRHYTVMVYENGRCLGRLDPSGYTTNRKVFAWILGRQRADEVAAEINAAGELSAKVKPF